jgi:hypothetical protein
MGFLVAIFTAVATFFGATGIVATVIGTVAAFATEVFLLTGISRLTTKAPAAAGTTDAGARVQLPPQTNNVIPVIYGSAFISPTITDAKISTDQNTMWYVCSLSEVTNTQNAGDTPDVFTFGDIYYDNKLVTFGSGDYGGYNNVVSLTTNSTPTQVDTKISGKLYMYLFPNGSSSGTNTGGKTAIEIMSNSGIPAGERWNGPIYTAGGQSAAMTNTAFIILKIVYDTNAGTTRLGSVTVQLNNPRDKPGDVLLDYFQNTRYGCAIPSDQLDTASFVALNTYSDEPITYAPVGGGTATQPRYRIDGPINTGQNCMTNLQQIADACDSWIAYNEVIGQWQAIINQSYLDGGLPVASLTPGKPYTISILGTTDWNTVAATTGITYHSGQTITVVNPGTGTGTAVPAPYQITDYNLIGGVVVNPIALQSTYNLLEVQYPDANIKDQTDYSYISLYEKQPALLSVNEPQNLLTVQLPITNNFVRATYIGERRLLMSRDGLTITCNLDYSGIQLTAGDVVAVPFVPYGWNNLNYNYGKLFRVMQVQEIKDAAGSLGISITATEYNETIYANDPIDQYIPDANTGLAQTTVIGTPAAPVAILTTANTVAAMHVEATVPTYSANYPGQVLFMDFNYGYNSNSSNHKLYTTISSSIGVPLVNGANVSVNVTDVPTGNVYWSVTARNQLVGAHSASTANAIHWIGPAVTTANVAYYQVANSVGNLLNLTSALDANTVTSWQLAVSQGANIAVAMVSGTGNIPANTYLSNVNSNLQLTITNVPTVALNNANVSFSQGGVTGNNIQANTITIYNMNNNVTTSEILNRYNYEVADKFTNVVTTPLNLNTFGALSTGHWGVPKFLNSVYSGSDASSYFPYFEGTSSTTNGYDQNSTSPLNPARAAQLLLYNGDFNWYVLDFLTTPTPIKSGQTVIISTNTQLVSTADTTIQILSFASFSLDPNLIGAPTDFGFNTIKLLANVPQWVTFRDSVTGSNTVIGAGTIIRQFNSATVYALTGTARLEVANN